MPIFIWERCRMRTSSPKLALPMAETIPDLCKVSLRCWLVMGKQNSPAGLRRVHNANRHRSMNGFSNLQYLIGVYIRQHLPDPARPREFDLVHDGCASKAEVYPFIARRVVTHCGCCLVVL